MGLTIVSLENYFNNPVDYFLDYTIITPEGVCMGIIEFEHTWYIQF